MHRGNAGYDGIRQAGWWILAAESGDTPQFDATITLRRASQRPGARYFGCKTVVELNHIDVIGPNGRVFEYSFRVGVACGRAELAAQSMTDNSRNTCSAP